MPALEGSQAWRSEGVPSPFPWKGRSKCRVEGERAEEASKISFSHLSF